MMNSEPYTRILDSYRKAGGDLEIFDKLFDKVGDDLSGVGSCIAVGPGPGVVEIKFLRKLAPRLRRLTCVERDDSCVFQLRGNLKTLTSVGIDVDVRQVFVQDWAGPVEKVDMVLMFHCLYYLNESERLEVLKKCYENWLKPGGRIYVMMIKDVYEGERHLMNEVYREQGGKLLTEAYHVKKDLASLGYKIGPELTYVNEKRWVDIDDSFVGFLKYHSDPVLDEPVIWDILKRLQDRGNDGHCCGSLFSAVKTG